jgi:hypothetical protein
VAGHLAAVDGQAQPSGLLGTLSNDVDGGHPISWIELADTDPVWFGAAAHDAMTDAAVTATSSTPSWASSPALRQDVSGDPQDPPIWAL